MNPQTLSGSTAALAPSQAEARQESSGDGPRVTKRVRRRDGTKIGRRGRPLPGPLGDRGGAHVSRHGAGLKDAMSRGRVQRYTRERTASCLLTEA